MNGSGARFLLQSPGRPKRRKTNNIGEKSADFLKHLHLPGCCLKTKWKTPDFSRFFSYPTTAQRCRSETEIFNLKDFFSSVLSQFKKYHPLETCNLMI